MKNTFSATIHGSRLKVSWDSNRNAWVSGVIGGWLISGERLESCLGLAGVRCNRLKGPGSDLLASRAERCLSESLPIIASACRADDVATVASCVDATLVNLLNVLEVM